ncbi:MAG: hypothetical protein Q4C45_08075 [Oscillospiraceae bacterium]|nr:hypothetical protein [Oscillospiraceae bacterium]
MIYLKKLLHTFCLAVFIGGSSAAALLGVFYLLRQMIQTNLLALELLVAVLLLCLALAYVVGAVLLVFALRNKKTMFR